MQIDLVLPIYNDVRMTLHTKFACSVSGSVDVTSDTSMQRPVLMLVQVQVDSRMQVT